MRSKSRSYRALFATRDGRLPPGAEALFELGSISMAGPACTLADMPLQVRIRRPDAVVVELLDAADLKRIEEVMAERPVPILVLHPPDLDAAGALALGALEVVARPGDPPRGFYPGLAPRLALLAQVQVVKHMKGARRPLVDAEPTAPFPLVAVASSLGGPKALAAFLRGIPRGFAAPICICQHISPGFTDGLAAWLKQETGLPVQEAVDGAALVPGSVYVAPWHAHFLVTAQAKVRLDDGAPVMGFRPSCNALLSSAALSFGKRALGVILTGMGKDGALGMKDIQLHGGHTIAQDEASSVVFGMPREAIELGAAAEVLPLPSIADAVIRKVGAC